MIVMINLTIIWLLRSAYGPIQYIWLSFYL